jgi:thioredoxin reductase
VELRGQPIALYGAGTRGLELSRAMTAWSDDLVLCTDGPAGFGSRQRRDLARNGIALEEGRIAGLEGEDGVLSAIRFRDGRKLPRNILFFDTPVHAQSALAQRLGCRMTKSGGILCSQYEATSVPGVFAAGNIVKDVQLAIVAAAEGARAAFGINRSLTREDFRRRSTGEVVVEHPREQPRLQRTA